MLDTCQTSLGELKPKQREGRHHKIGGTGGEPSSRHVVRGSVGLAGGGKVMVSVV